MTIRSELIEGTLASLDPQFTAIGFKRSRGDQEWRRRVDSGHFASLHLNFGKNADPLLVTVSVGLAIPTLEAMLQAAGYRAQGTDRSLTFGRTLGTLESRTTGSDTPAADIGARIWTLWSQQGHPFLDAATDLAAMADLLRGQDPRAWPCPSRSHRARLLPLTLWELGDQTGAIASLDWLSDDLEDTDQLRPSFSTFATWLRNKANSAV